jgi:hypothetical protein
MDVLIELGKQTAALFEKGQKGYRRLRNAAAILAVILSLILGVIIGTAVPQNGGAISQAGQSLIAVDGFLAAASGVIAFFYSGKLFEFVSPSSSLMLAMRPIIVASFQVTAKKEFEKSMQGLAEQVKSQTALTAAEIAEGQKRVFEALGATTAHLFEETGKVVRDMTSPARRMAYYAAFVLMALIVSAFFSTLAILGGSAPYLGAGFGFTALGSGFLALAWSDAHVNLTRFLIAVQAHESLRSQPIQPSIA